MYPLSATRLKTYQRCPQAYHLRYEQRVPTVSRFGSQALGRSLHAALERFHGDWHYQEAIPNRAWMRDCWAFANQPLSDRQKQDGATMLDRYYERFIEGLPTLDSPLGLEGRIQGSLVAEGIEFKLSGRYDRLQYLADGLELIDYKLSRPADEDSAEFDLQLSLYYLALEQQYRAQLSRVSLIYLRSGECDRFEVDAGHRELVVLAIGELALRLREERSWSARPDTHCDVHEVHSLFPTINPSASEPSPPSSSIGKGLQLVPGIK